MKPQSRATEAVTITKTAARRQPSDRLAVPSSELGAASRLRFRFRLRLRLPQRLLRLGLLFLLRPSEMPVVRIAIVAGSPLAADQDDAQHRPAHLAKKPHRLASCVPRRPLQARDNDDTVNVIYECKRIVHKPDRSRVNENHVG